MRQADWTMDTLSYNLDKKTIDPVHNLYDILRQTKDNGNHRTMEKDLDLYHNTKNHAMGHKKLSRWQEYDHKYDRQKTEYIKIGATYDGAHKHTTS